MQQQPNNHYMFTKIILSQLNFEGTNFTQRLKSLI